MAGANDREETPRATKCGKRRAKRHGDNARQDREPRPDKLRRNGRKSGGGVPCPGGLAIPYRTGGSDAPTGQPWHIPRGAGGQTIHPPEGRERSSPPFPSRARRRAAPIHRAAPSIPHTQQNGAVLAVRSGADDPRLQCPEMRPTSGGGSTPKKIYM